MTTRKKKPFWTKLLSALLIASMLMGTAGISSLAAGAPEADTVSGNSVTGDEKTTETPAASGNDGTDEVDSEEGLLKTDTVNEIEKVSEETISDVQKFLNAVAKLPDSITTAEEYDAVEAAMQEILPMYQGLSEDDQNLAEVNAVLPKLGMLQEQLGMGRPELAATDTVRVNLTVYIWDSFSGYGSKTPSQAGLKTKSTLPDTNVKLSNGWPPKTTTASWSGGVDKFTGTWETERGSASGTVTLPSPNQLFSNIESCTGYKYANSYGSSYNSSSNISSDYQLPAGAQGTSIYLMIYGLKLKSNDDTTLQVRTEIRLESATGALIASDDGTAKAVTAGTGLEVINYATIPTYDTNKYGSKTFAKATRTSGGYWKTYAGSSTNDSFTTNPMRQFFPASGTNKVTVIYTVPWKNYTITYTDGRFNGAAFANREFTDRHYGDTTPAYTPAKNEYTDADGKTWTFKGWAPAVKDTVDGNQTYNAKWEEKEKSYTYKLHYNANKPSSATENVTNMPSPNPQTSGSTTATTWEPVVSSTEPQLTGYTFNGWNIQVNGNGTPYSGGSTVTGYSATSTEKTIYAQWTENQYTIKWVDGFVGDTWALGTGAQLKAVPDILYTNINNTIEAEKPANPTKTGYRFTGWSGPEYDHVNKTVTVTAKWEEFTANPSMTINKTVSDATVGVDKDFTYTITVKNTGNVELTNVRITDDLANLVDDGLEFVSASLVIKETGKSDVTQLTGYNGTTNKEAVVTKLPAGASAVLTITVKATEAGKTLTNTANASSTEIIKPETSGPVTTVVDDGKGLTITKQRENNATTAKIGDTIWWTVKVKNNSNVEKTVTLTEQLSGAKLMETKTEPLPDTAPNTLTLTLNAGDEKIVYAGYVVEETDYNKADHKLINTVTTNDPGNPEVKDPGTTIVTPSTTLTVEKKADKEKVVAGEEVTYTITVTNGSQYDAENVVIADPLTDANLEFVSWKLNDGTESDVAPSDGKYEIGTVNGNASATLTITAKVSENAAEGTKISNTVTVSYSNKPDDPSDPDKKIDDPTDSEEIEVVDEPTVLTIKKTANKEKVAAGDTVKYTITVENTGDVAAKNVKVTDELPKELTFVSAKLDGSDVTANADGEYEIPVLSGKTKTELVITATVDTDAVVGTELENTATADYKNKPEKDPTDETKPFETPEDTATVEVVEKEEADRVITIQYVDEDGNVLKEITVTKDPESGDPYKKDVNYDVTSEITDEFTDDEGHHYVKDGEPDVPPTGTVEDEDIVIKVPYALDDLVDPTAPGADPTDPNKKGDGIPDKYQVVVTFRAVNGTVTGAGEDGTYKLVVTLVDDNGDYATPEDGGKLTLTAEQIPGTTANTGYGNGVWDKEPSGAVVTGNITFTITYTATTPTPDPTPGGGDDPTPTPPGGGGGGGGGTPDPTPTPTPTPGPAPVVPVPAAVTPVVPAAPAPAATPVAATPVAAAPAAEGPAIEALEDEAVPLAAGGDEEAPELAALDDEEVPLAPGNGARWALINFALMNLAIFESLMLLIGYFVKTKNDKEDDDEKRKLKKKGIFRILSIPVAVISLIAFILTEDITLPTGFVDKYTIIMLIIAVVQTVVVALSNKKYEDEEEA